MYSFSAARVHLDVGPSTEAWATTNGHTPKKTPPASLIINTQIVPRIRGGTFWAAFHTCGNFYCHLPPFRQFFISLEFTNLTRLACQWAVGTLLFLPAQCWESRAQLLPAFLCGVLQSSPLAHACKANVLLTSPQTLQNSVLKCQFLTWKCCKKHSQETLGQEKEVWMSVNSTYINASQRYKRKDY